MKIVQSTILTIFTVSTSLLLWVLLSSGSQIDKKKLIGKVKSVEIFIVNIKHQINPNTIHIVKGSKIL